LGENDIWIAATAKTVGAWLMAKQLIAFPKKLKLMRSLIHWTQEDEKNVFNLMAEYQKCNHWQLQGCVKNATQSSQRNTEGHRGMRNTKRCVSL
jgi:hypothetical protein